MLVVSLLLGMISLFAGIISIFIGPVSIAGIVIACGAITLSVFSFRKYKNGLSIAGITISSIDTIFNFVMMIVWIVKLVG